MVNTYEYQYSTVIVDKATLNIKVFSDWQSAVFGSASVLMSPVVLGCTTAHGNCCKGSVLTSNTAV